MLKSTVSARRTALTASACGPSNAVTFGSRVGMGGKEDEGAEEATVNNKRGGGELSEARFKKEAEHFFKCSTPSTSGGRLFVGFGLCACASGGTHTHAAHMPSKQSACFVAVPTAAHALPYLSFLYYSDA
eukprot:355947-Chlamydomonas_euryale.AAC.12